MRKPPKLISDYMRKLQRKGAARRWSKVLPEDRSAIMRRVRAGKPIQAAWSATFATIGSDMPSIKQSV